MGGGSGGEGSGGLFGPTPPPCPSSSYGHVRWVADGCCYFVEAPMRASVNAHRRSCARPSTHTGVRFAKLRFILSPCHEGRQRFPCAGAQCAPPLPPPVPRLVPWVTASPWTPSPPLLLSQCMIWVPLPLDPLSAPPPVLVHDLRGNVVDINHFPRSLWARNMY